jgi:hypothetical protein
VLARQPCDRIPIDPGTEASGFASHPFEWFAFIRFPTLSYCDSKRKLFVVPPRNRISETYFNTFSVNSIGRQADNLNPGLLASKKH